MKRILSSANPDMAYRAVGFRRPHRTAFAAIPFTVVALALGLANGRIEGQNSTNLLQAVDINQDGLSDLQAVYVVERFWGPFGAEYYFIYLEAQGANALLDVPAPLSTNDLVALDPIPGSTWQPRLCLWCQARVCPPVFTYLPYVGIRFQSADGSHLGWLHVSGSRVTDFGWQPRPGEPIRVGDKPVAPPGPEEWSQATPVDLDGGGIDCVLRVRRWTNLVAGVVGTSAVLTSRPGFEVLAIPGVVGEKAVWHPWPAPPGYLIRSQPPPTAVWLEPTEGLVLLEARHGLDGTLLWDAGPLAAGAPVVVVRMSNGQVGWCRFGGGFLVQAQDFGSSRPAVGEPPRQPNEEGRTRWDLNDDGRIEFVLISRRQSGNDMLGSWSHRWEDLHPIAPAGILSGPGLAADEIITATAPAARLWQNTSVLLRESSESGGPPEKYERPGLLGLRFGSEAGVHLGWARLDGSFAYEPRPGVALKAGMIPKSLGAAISGDQPVLSWNRSLTNHTLEHTASLEASVWQPIPTESPGRAVWPLTKEMTLADNAFFWLALPQLKPGPLQAFPELPGAVHAVAFRDDGDHLVVVDDTGPRRLRADGAVDAEASLVPAEFRFTGAVLSANGAYAICAGGVLPNLLPTRRSPLGISGVAIWIHLNSQPVRPAWWCPDVDCNMLPSGRPWTVYAISADGQQALLGELAHARVGTPRTLRILPGAAPAGAFSPDGLQVTSP